ncbi:MAG: hypothetical protein ACJZ03_01285 [Candidatus Neomarinimicrobiota bacterium]
MKLVTKIAAIATLASFMFAGMNINWGNTYSDDPANAGDMLATPSFGVHFDVNDNTTFGWEGGLMVGLAGPAGSTFRLGYTDGAQTLGMSYTWWEGAGTGWGTNLSTAVDYTLVGGGFDITVNLGLGF